MCGFRMDENMGTLAVGQTGTKPLLRTKSGFGRPMLFGVIGAVALAAAAVGLGFIATEDDDTVAEIRQSVPGIKVQTPDGWSVVTSEPGKFSSEFPNAYTDARLLEYGIELAGVPEDKIDADSKVDILGLRGYQFQEEKQVEPGVYRTFNTILFLNGDRLYMIESASKEDPAATTTDPPPEFTRVAETMSIIA